MNIFFWNWKKKKLYWQGPQKMMYSQNTQFLTLFYGNGYFYEWYTFRVQHLYCRRIIILRFSEYFHLSSTFTERHANIALPKRCPYSEFFWSIFSRIRTRKNPNTSIFHTVLITRANALILQLTLLHMEFR